MVQKIPFLSTFRVENVQVEVGGGQKRAKLCPRSHCLSPYSTGIPEEKLKLEFLKKNLKEF